MKNKSKFWLTLRVGSGFFGTWIFSLKEMVHKIFKAKRNCITKLWKLKPMFQSYKIGWLIVSLNAKNRVKTTLEPGIQVLSLTAIEESEFLSALTLQAVFESRTYLFAARRCMNFGSKVMCETTFTATQCRPLNGCSAQDWTEREKN